MDYGGLTSCVGISSSNESMGCVSLSHSLNIKLENGPGRS